MRPIEKEIYEALWQTSEYRQFAPGEECVNDFLQQAHPKQGATVFDIGCGTGRAGLLLALMGGCNVTMMDFAANCLDEDILPILEAQPHALRFVQADVTDHIPGHANYAFVSDMMEHILPECINNALNNILLSCQHCFFQIATRPDIWGEKLVGHPLHLSVFPFSFWLDQFRQRDCVIHYSKEEDGQCQFYVSAWASGDDIQKCGSLNVEEETMRRNVRTNCEAGWQQVVPHSTDTSLELMILGGSPSLNEFEDKIRELRANGVKLITMNGSYNWCLERGIKPSAQVIVDARPFNARFTQPVIDDCRYLICSQCDPSVLEGLPRDRTWLWHTGAELNRDILDEVYDKCWYWIPGGSTVLLRTIPLMRMLGYVKMHIFGCDGCVIGEQHHAYEQKENDPDPVFVTTVGDENRMFYTTGWHVHQASDFVSVLQFLGDEVSLQFYGDGGLLKYIHDTAGTITPKQRRKKPGNDTQT